MTPEEEIDEVLDLLGDYEGDSLIDLVRAVLAHAGWLEEELDLAKQQLHACSTGSKKLMAQVEELTQRVKGDAP